MSPKILSSERIQDSSVEAESDLSETEEQPDNGAFPTKLVNGTKSHKRKSDSDHESGAKRQKLTTPDRHSKQRKSENKDQNGNSEESHRRANSDDGSGDGSDANDDSAGSSGRPTPKTNGNVTRTPNSTSPATIQAPDVSIPWHPPSDFEKIPATTQNTDSLARLFSTDFLEGKQLWHITAPSSVSLDSIPQFSSEDVKKGKAFLSHQGADYAFVKDKSRPNRNAFPLVPTKDGRSSYRAVPSFSQTLHLQQVVLPHAQLPAIYDASALPAKQIRAQPKGLRTRFWPAGFESSTNEGTNHVGSANDATETSSSADDSESGSSATSAEETEEDEAEEEIEAGDKQKKAGEGDGESDDESNEDEEEKDEDGEIATDHASPLTSTKTSQSRDDSGPKFRGQGDASAGSSQSKVSSSSSSSESSSSEEDSSSSQ